MRGHVCIHALNKHVVADPNVVRIKRCDTVVDKRGGGLVRHVGLSTQRKHGLHRVLDANHAPHRVCAVAHVVLHIKHDVVRGAVGRGLVHASVRHLHEHRGRLVAVRVG